MENGKHLDLGKQDSPEELPALIKYIAANEVDGFDGIKVKNDLGNQNKPTAVHSLNPSARVTNTEFVQIQNGFQQCERMHSLSISMTPSPLEAHMHNGKKVFFRDDAEVILSNDATESSAASHDANVKQTKFYSQPLPKGFALDKAAAIMNFPKSQELPSKNPRIDKFKDRRFDSFKTWSGKLERQLSHLKGRQLKTEPEEIIPDNPEVDTPPVDRYFDALEGPELDTLRASEKLLLPEDRKWPFLLRYPISSFGICLGVSSQAILWKTLATSASTKFLHVSLKANFILWCISIALVAIVSFIYSLKVIFYFEAVRREYYHPIRVNFFFAPWIALLFLAIGVPPSISQNLHQALWYILMIPIFCLELKIYGQWMSGGQRRLSKVANPSNHLSIVGNFVGALLGASMGLKEGPIFFFSVGLAHYIVLFVTLYQRLPTNETLPKELHPVFFLFVAAPSVASIAWAKIQGSFDYGSRVAFFIALFLYFSLAVRVNFFRGFRFSLSWWAYTFPMTGASIATIAYTNEVTNIVTRSLAVVLCSVATLTIIALLITTIIHACILRDLFPNDVAIAISERRPKMTRKWYHRRSGSSDTKDSNSHTQCAYLDGKGIEASAIPPSSTD